jgi:3-oxoacyl-(acyl-carrier-protein) synthase
LSLNPEVDLRRVVVTGVGLVSPLGHQVDVFWNNLLVGKSGISRHPNPAIPYPVGYVTIDLTQEFARSQINSLDRTALFALKAAKSAVEDAGLAYIEAFGDIAGVLFGSGYGGADSIEQGYAKYFSIPNAQKKLLTVPAVMIHAAASHIGIRYGVTGECQTYSTACSSATVAIGEAFRRIRSGELEIALTGGSDCMLVPCAMSNWGDLKVLCADPAAAPGTGCRPFSHDRNGFAISEGACVLILEELSSALKRGAAPYCEIVGFGVSNDATHITKPQASGQARAISKALASANLDRDAVGYINAHGTATKVGDAVEVESLQTIWGDKIASIPVSSTKSALGHMMGATGAIEFLACALAIKNQIVPPTTHWSGADPDWNLDFVPHKGRRVEGLRYALSNSFAFGGNNAVLIAGRIDA